MVLDSQLLSLQKSNAFEKVISEANTNPTLKQAIKDTAISLKLNQTQILQLISEVKKTPDKPLELIAAEIKHNVTKEKGEISINSRPEGFISWFKFSESKRPLAGSLQNLQKPYSKDLWP